MDGACLLPSQHHYTTTPGRAGVYRRSSPLVFLCRATARPGMALAAENERARSAGWRGCAYTYPAQAHAALTGAAHYCARPATSRAREGTTVLPDVDVAPPHASACYAPPLQTRFSTFTHHATRRTAAAATLAMPLTFFFAAINQASDGRWGPLPRDLFTALAYRARHATCAAVATSIAMA